MRPTHATKPAMLTRRRGDMRLRRYARGTRTGAQLALDVVERGVADVLAVDHVDDVLADVLGVIADALERAHHPQRRLDVHARKGVEGVVHHLRYHAPEMLDLAVLVGGPLHGREAGGDVADLLGLVADALEVGDGLDDRADHAQVTGGRRPGGEDAAALVIDGDLHVVHLVVVHRDRLAERAVALDEGRNPLLQLLLDETAHAEHLAAHALEVLVETTRDVVTEISGFHPGAP